MNVGTGGLLKFAGIVDTTGNTTTYLADPGFIFGAGEPALAEAFYPAAIDRTFENLAAELSQSIPGPLVTAALAPAGVRFEFVVDGNVAFTKTITASGAAGIGISFGVKTILAGQRFELRALPVDLTTNTPAAIFVNVNNVATPVGIGATATVGIE